MFVGDQEYEKNLKYSVDEIHFGIVGEDVRRLKEFKKQHEKCFEKHHDVSGAQYEYCFIPTGLGTVITVKCPCGAVLNLGDFLK